MAAEKGAGFLLKVSDGAVPPNWQTVAGLKTTTFAINHATIDVTNKGSAGWRELLGGAGVTSVSIAGAGVFNGSASEAKLSADALAGALDAYQVVFDSGGKFAGTFQITKLEYAGDYNNERTYTVALESSGPVVAQ